MKATRTLVAIILGAVLVGFAGCDWFEDVNTAPTIELRSACPGTGQVLEGDNVTFAWLGTDFDGTVASYEWSYDGAAWVGTEADSAVIDSVTAGQHTFSVRARDNSGALSAKSADCSFTVLPKGVERVALVELFTTNKCQNCPKAEAALNTMLTEFGLDRLVVVAYHDKPSDAPNSDGLATDETDARIGWYTADENYFPEQWPIAVFDGLRPMAGAETADQAAALYRFEISSRLEVVSPIQLTLTGQIGETSGNVAAGVKVAGRLPGDPLVLRFAVIENEVSYNGYFAKVFDFVTRDLLDDQTLTLAAYGDSTHVEQDFAVQAGWVTDNMDVIAFVQDISTREVLQAARLKHE
ncbi:MAG TPA: hypothetical protein VMU02_07765 [bacterium]|nr:hypothetical protein [bacterium]